jgi:hypothetical protein
MTCLPASLFTSRNLLRKPTLGAVRRFGQRGSKFFLNSEIYFISRRAEPATLALSAKTAFHHKAPTLAVLAYFREGFCNV